MPKLNIIILLLAEFIKELFLMSRMPNGRKGRFLKGGSGLCTSPEYRQSIEERSVEKLGGGLSFDYGG